MARRGSGGERWSTPVEPISVLIVEDDPMVAEIHRQFIVGVPGFRVIGAARTGAEAIAAVESRRPDLLLLDVYLPDRSGVEVLREVRQRGLPADAILITAAQDAPVVRDTLRYGATDYIIKPFRVERLRAALDAYRRNRERLGQEAALSQEQVDRVLRGRPATTPPLPKGLQPLTLERVAAYLTSARGPVTAVELAEALGMARVTARRYLDFLVQRDRASVDIRYGAVGRPVHWYQEK
jgi:two-component system, CitB family, response regulator DctR